MGSKAKGRRIGFRDERGSSMIYVILFITLLAVFTCGYMSIAGYNRKTTKSSRNYMEAQMAAKTIHRTFCEAVSSGDSEAMNCIWQSFEEDCSRVREEYEEMLAEEEEEQDDGMEDDGMEDGVDYGVEDSADYGMEDSADYGMEDGADYAMEADADYDAEDAGDSGIPGTEAESRWERYLYHALGDKEYIIRGTKVQSGDKARENLEADITLTAKPLGETAQVHTKVTCNGYTFSMRADIVFDDSDGAVMTIGWSTYSRSSRNVEVYLNGNGVYRYYED